MRRTTIAGHCTAYILENGPTPLDELAYAVKSAGLTRARDPRGPTKQAIAFDPRLIQLPGGRYDATARILEGSWFTTRTRYRQPDRHHIFAARELDPLMTMVRREPITLRGGGHVEVDEHGPAPALVGPAGWLPDCPAGALLGLQLKAGELVVAPVEVDEDAVAGEISRVRALIARHAHAIGRRSYFSTEPLGRVIVSALIEAPDLLHTPLPPLDEVLTLPPSDGASDWSGHLLYHEHDGATITLNGLPPALHTELQDRAQRMGTTLSEYVVLLLAADAWRWQPPCVHDLQRQRAEAALARRSRDLVYDDDALPNNVIQLGHEDP
jgi:hypothetical protein